MAGTQNQIGLKSSYGYIWMNAGNWTGNTFAFTTSYQELTSLGTSFTLASPSQDFSMTTDGQLKYTEKTTKLFSIDAQYSYNIGTIRFAMQLYKNGSALSGSESYIGAGSGINMLKFPITMATNDYVSVYAKRQAATTTTIFQAILSASIANGS